MKDRKQRHDMKIYMDVCCLNRPFDNQKQDRIHLEAEAILSILSRCQYGVWSLTASEIIELELSKSGNTEKMEKVWALYSLADQDKQLIVTERDKLRSRYFQDCGIKPFDSLHLALAEANGNDVLLTTDDKFLTAANKSKPNIVVANPVSWLMEVLKNE